MKIHRVSILRNDMGTLNYTVKHIDGRNPACLMMTGIQRREPGMGYDEDRTILVPWHTIAHIDVQEENVTE